MGKPMGSGFTSIREARVPKVFLRIEKNRFPGDSPKHRDFRNSGRFGPLSVEPEPSKLRQT